MPPDPHPDPPSDLGSRDLLLRDTRQNWVRLHRVSQDPIYFGSTGKNRFDAPGAEYGVMYVAADLHGAAIETFGRSYSAAISVGSLGVTGFAQIRSSRELHLIDLVESGGLTRIGADARLCSDCDYSLTQKWSKAIYDHPASVDGIFYRSRLDYARFACAIFDRATGVITADRLGSLDRPEHAIALGEVLTTYRWALV